MGFNCGIVGMPNVGKSTLFNALTRAGIDAENFPFCTKWEILSINTRTGECVEQCRLTHIGHSYNTAVESH